MDAHAPQDGTPPAEQGQGQGAGHEAHAPADTPKQNFFRRRPRLCAVVGAVLLLIVLSVVLHPGPTLTIAPGFSYDPDDDFATDFAVIELGDRARIVFDHDTWVPATLTIYEPLGTETGEASTEPGQQLGCWRIDIPPNGVVTADIPEFRLDHGRPMVWKLSWGEFDRFHVKAIGKSQRKAPEVGESTPLGSISWTSSIRSVLEPNEWMTFHDLDQVASISDGGRALPSGEELSEFWSEKIIDPLQRLRHRPIEKTGQSP